MDIEVDLKSLSPSDWTNVLGDLNRKRLEANLAWRRRNSLRVLAMKALLQNSSHFTGAQADVFFSERSESGNSLCNKLPNTVIRDLLEFLKMSKKFGEDLIPDECAEFEFVARLLNPQLLRFSDWKDLSSWCERSPGLKQVMRCASITSTTCPPWRDESRELPRLPFDGPLLKISWFERLKFLSMREFLFTTDNTLEQIQTFLPNLVGLEFTVSTAKFTRESVQHLAKMEKLLYLGAHASYYQGAHGFTEIFAHAAGRIPHLKRIFFGGAILSNAFVEIYKQFYGGKKLTIVDLVFCWQTLDGVIEYFRARDLEGCWPSYLSVQKLTFLGHFPCGALKNFSMMPVEQLVFHHTPVSLIYTIIEKCGNSLIYLSIETISPTDSSKLNLYRVLSLAPNLAALKVIGCDFKKDLECDITPRHFRKLKLFTHVPSPRCSRNHEQQVYNIFPMFLLGSEAIQDIFISEQQFGVVQEFLGAYPDRFQKLQSIFIYTHIELDEYGVIVDNTSEALEVAAKLILCSPCLRLVSLKFWIGSAAATLHQIYTQHRWFETLTRGAALRVEVYDQAIRKLTITNTGDCDLKKVYNSFMEVVHGIAWHTMIQLQHLHLRD